MRPIEQIQAINEQANGPGVWETPKPKPATDHVALQASINSGHTQIFMIDGVEHFRTVTEDGEVTVTTL